jgi:hypothetical protein
LGINVKTADILVTRNATRRWSQNVFLNLTLG